MNKLLSSVKRKQRGFVLSSELVLIVTILVIGLVAGLVTMRDSITAEMHDVSESLGALDQGYQFGGVTNNSASGASAAGSSWGDAVDTNAGDFVGFTFTVPANGEVSAGSLNPGGDAASFNALFFGGIPVVR